ncbi:MAG: single-stranded DNA-binding protein [Minisyncoccota bacterium]
MINLLVFEGRLTKDAEIKYTKDGKPLAFFTLIQNGVGKYKDNITSINCTIFFRSDDMAEKVIGMFSKGNMFSVEGRVYNNNWTDDKGSKHYTLGINVSSFHLLQVAKANRQNFDNYEDGDDSPASDF